MSKKMKPMASNLADRASQAAVWGSNMLMIMSVFWVLVAGFSRDLSLYPIAGWQLAIGVVESIAARRFRCAHLCAAADAAAEDANRFAICSAHYSTKIFDWYIIGNDIEDETTQRSAWMIPKGWEDRPVFGCISIKELREIGAVLDPNFTPQFLQKLKNNHDI
jgi:hypothetical protein